MMHKNHPRYESLKLRHKIVEASKKGILADSGMIAHGRGEAFDYLIGEKTSENAKKAINAAAAKLILSEHPVISVNGNTAALVPEEIVMLTKLIDAKLEINLFYRTPERVGKIEKLLDESGADHILGIVNEEKMPIEGLEGPRGLSSAEGVYVADTVLVPLEDGDRAEALVKLGKYLITIDLNPLSRTAQTAHITIVDNIVRAVPHLIVAVEKLKDVDPSTLEQMVDDFDNQENISESLKKISMKYTGKVRS